MPPLRRPHTHVRPASVGQSEASSSHTVSRPGFGSVDGEQFMTSFSKLGSLLMCRNSLIRVAQAIKMRHFSARKYFISLPLLFYHYTRSCFAYPLNSFNVFKILFIVGRCVRGCACKCKIEFILLHLGKEHEKCSSHAAPCGLWSINFGL